MTGAIQPLGEAGREAFERFRVPGLVAGAAVVLGTAVVVQPIAAAALVAVALLAAFGLGDRQRLPRLFLGALGILLLGYALVGRGFSYLGVAPLYPGEMVLAIGLVAGVVGGGILLALRSPVSWAYLALAAWGLACTIPYVGEYGIDALRDAAIWAYGLFAILGAAALLRTGWWRRVPFVYAKATPWLLILFPLVYPLGVIAQRFFPKIPNTPEAFIPEIKPGDMEVQLAGLGAFLLLGLRERLLGARARLPEPLLWSLWLVAFVLAATSNRGGMVAIAAALGTVLLLRPSGRWLKVALPALLILGLGVAADVRINLRMGREVSVRQLAFNAVSVFGVEGQGQSLQSTVEWRTSWWRDIVDYTVHGPYRWTGKGYGVNLGNDDGYQTEKDDSLRSPHNGHMTILARSGVPGLALWTLLHLTFGVSMLAAYFRARSRGQETWARIDLWILAFWVAFLVNAAFDVFLEGPMGGIWFWSLTGFGIAMLEAQRRGLAANVEATA
jgi:O-antigen ligase